MGVDSILVYESERKDKSPTVQICGLSKGLTICH